VKLVVALAFLLLTPGCASLEQRSGTRPIGASYHPGRVIPPFELYRSDYPATAVAVAIPVLPVAAVGMIIASPLMLSSRHNVELLGVGALIAEIVTLPITLPVAAPLALVGVTIDKTIHELRARCTRAQPRAVPPERLP
jgi:hypothetical protein